MCFRQLPTTGHLECRIGKEICKIIIATVKESKKYYALSKEKKEAT